MVPLPYPGREALKSFPVRFSFRRKLVALVLCALVPLLLTTTIGTYLRFNEHAEAELQSSLELSQVTAVAFRNFVQSLWDIELAIGSAVCLNEPPLPYADVQALMLRQTLTHPALKAISWTDPDGVVAASTNPLARGVSLADREHIRRILAGAETAVSDLIDSRLVDGRVFAVARGIRREGRLRGIVTASVQPESLGLILPIHRTRGGHIVLVDRRGTIIYRSNDPGSSVGRPTGDTPSWSALRGRPATSRSFRWGEGEPEQIGAAVPIREIGWAASASVPVAQALQPARRAVSMDLWTLAVIAALSVAAAGLIGQDLLRRARALKQAAVAITDGDLSARTNLPPGRDELAVAGAAFDRMASHIQSLEKERIRFIQVAAHELRTPLTALKGVSNLLQQSLRAHLSDSDVGRLAQVLEQEVDHVTILVNEILETFLIQEGRLSLRRETTDLVEVVSSALKPFATSEDHRISFTPPGETEDGSVLVSGDPLRLGQVVRNLVSNAVKYSPPQSVIDVALTADGVHALLTVSDHGLGIPEDQLTSVFEPFERATNLTSRRDAGGLGLGLYITKDIVERHGGRIWVVSREGEGSTFYVQLPLAGEAA